VVGKVIAVRKVMLEVETMLMVVGALMAPFPTSLKREATMAMTMVVIMNPFTTEERSRGCNGVVVGEEDDEVGRNG
jgi:hypothetical protein